MILIPSVGRKIGRTLERALRRSFWHSNVGRADEKGYIEPDTAYSSLKGIIYQHIWYAPHPFRSDIEESRAARAHSLFCVAGFHRNNMLIARRRSLKSAPINSRDFWRNFAPSHHRSVFRKILFARAFRRLERTLPYQRTPGIYHQSDIPLLRSP